MNWFDDDWMRRLVELEMRMRLDPQAMDLYSAEDDVFYGGMSEVELRGMKPELTIAQAMMVWTKVRASAIAARLWPSFVAAPMPTIHFPKIGEAMTGPNDLIQEQETGRTDILNRQVFYQNSGLGMTTSNILHEMAHIIVLDTYGFEAFQEPRRMQGHGVEFAEVYLTLVKNFLPEKAGVLEQAYEKHHVNYKEQT